MHDESNWVYEHMQKMFDEAGAEDYFVGTVEATPSLDDPLNQDEIGEKELLVVSFGTSFNDSRRLTIGAIEKAIQEAYPDWSVRRAFTSQIIIDHVKSRDGEVIDNVTEALDRAVANNVKVLFVQPTHLMDGFEFNDLKNELASYADAFEQIVIGKPLLQRDADFGDLCEALADATNSYIDGETAIVLMGHGTEAASPTGSMSTCRRCLTRPAPRITLSALWRPLPLWMMCWQRYRPAITSAWCCAR